MSNPTKKSYAEQVSRAQVMSVALKSNLKVLQKRGMTEEFIASLDSKLGKAVELNSEQERLKAALKATTASLDATLAEMSTSMSEAVKVVKLGVPQEQWKEFGIQAKK